MWLYGFAKATLEYVCSLGCSHRMNWRSNMPFSRTLSNQLISYSCNSGWISTGVILRNDNPHSRWDTSIKCLHSLVSISSVLRHNLSKLMPQKALSEGEFHTVQFCFYAVLQMSVLPPASSKYAEI
ncbi:hypothetical protein TNCV_1357861 [Trichonephila clavipes]|uniref:Uncharacterized protein n=1 Tax=Trichonephila clavipes TaxID=2585209 RepID=A0A8X6SBM0_TRICX|nr:hypothetical protein TNCV_1357861 [Trichonephila clavipes]